MLKVNYEDPGQQHWRCSGISIVNFKQTNADRLTFGSKYSKMYPVKLV